MTDQDAPRRAPRDWNKTATVGGFIVALIAALITLLAWWFPRSPDQTQAPSVVYIPAEPHPWVNPTYPVPQSGPRVVRVSLDPGFYVLGKPHSAHLEDGDRCREIATGGHAVNALRVCPADAYADLVGPHEIQLGHDRTLGMRVLVTGQLHGF